MPRASHSPEEIGRKHGWRSGLEGVNADHLDAQGTTFAYERVVVPYEVVELRTYTPDFVLPNGIIVETKGRFVTADRKRHRLIKAQHPELDIRFVFSSSRARISKTSKTTYGAWATAQGFPYADKVIPAAWSREPADRGRQDAILRLIAISKPERVAELLKLFNRRKLPT